MRNPAPAIVLAATLAVALGIAACAVEDTGNACKELAKVREFNSKTGAFGPGGQKVYRFTPHSTTDYTFDLTNNDLISDPVLNVYAACASSGSSSYTLSARLKKCDSNGVAQDESCTVALTAGETVWVRITDYNDLGGDFDLYVGY